jgi:hypothetical protein
MAVNVSSSCECRRSRRCDLSIYMADLDIRGRQAGVGAKARTGGSGRRDIRTRRQDLWHRGLSRQLPTQTAHASTSERCSPGATAYCAERRV